MIERSGRLNLKYRSLTLASPWLSVTLCEIFAFWIKLKWVGPSEMLISLSEKVMHRFSTLIAFLVEPPNDKNSSSLMTWVGELLLAGFPFPTSPQMEITEAIKITNANKNRWLIENSGYMPNKLFFEKWFVTRRLVPPNNSANVRASDATTTLNKQNSSFCGFQNQTESAIKNMRVDWLKKQLTRNQNQIQEPIFENFISCHLPVRWPYWWPAPRGVFATPSLLSATPSEGESSGIGPYRNYRNS